MPRSWLGVSLSSSESGSLYRAARNRSFLLRREQRSARRGDSGVSYGCSGAGEPDRVLATVLFADIVGTTELAAKIGDRRWHVVLEAYYAAISRGTRTIPRK